MSLSSVPTICILCGSSWLFNAFAEDITNDLSLIKINPSKNRNRREFYSHFCNIVHHYSELKELSDKIYSSLSNSNADDGMNFYLFFC